MSVKLFFLLLLFCSVWHEHGHAQKKKEVSELCVMSPADILGASGELPADFGELSLTYFLQLA